MPSLIAMKTRSPKASANCFMWSNVP
jgi:hypothetical protein